MIVYGPVRRGRGDAAEGRIKDAGGGGIDGSQSVENQDGAQQGRLAAPQRPRQRRRAAADLRQAQLENAPTQALLVVSVLVRWVLLEVRRRRRSLPLELVGRRRRGGVNHDVEEDRGSTAYSVRVRPSRQYLRASERQLPTEYTTDVPQCTVYTLQMERSERSKPVLSLMTKRLQCLDLPSVL